MEVRDADPHAVENPGIALQLALCILGSASADLTTLDRVELYLMKKHSPCISGPVQFKPILLKSQLYSPFSFKKIKLLREGKKKRCDITI